MVVVFILAGLAVLGAVVVLAMGRGGELAETHPDHPPLPLPEGRRLTGPEVTFLRLPRGLWGYQVPVTDEALRRLAGAITERDDRLAVLERQVDDLRRRLGEPDGPIGALHGIQEQAVANGTPIFREPGAPPRDGPLDDPKEEPVGEERS